MSVILLRKKIKATLDNMNDIFLFVYCKKK